ncbi:hypothetical protein SGLAM104S_08747 [Streptomyces glaucescens]
MTGPAVHSWHGRYRTAVHVSGHRARCVAWKTQSADARSAGVGIRRPSHAVETEEGNAELAGCARGEPEAWDETVDRFGALVWTVARSQRVSRAEAEDVRQLTWFRLMQNAHRIRDPDRLGDWLATVARREAVKADGRARRLVTIGDTETLEYLVDHRGHHESPEQITLRADRDRELLRAIDTPVPPVPGRPATPSRDRPPATRTSPRPSPYRSAPSAPSALAAYAACAAPWTPRPPRRTPRGGSRLPGGDRRTRGPAAARAQGNGARTPHDPPLRSARHHPR